MECLVFGNGWLGNRLAEHFDGSVAEADILDTERVASVLMDVRPDVVINAAGKCGTPNIDWCEASDTNRRLTLYANAYGPPVLYHMAEAVGQHLSRSFFFVHLSSGCLWNEEYDVDEQTKPNPVSWYSETKVQGENRLPSEDVLILRLRMPVDNKPHPRNLITKLANYHFVLDEPNSVTFIDDFLAATEYLVEKRTTGIFNLVNPGPLTAWEIMQLYVELVDDNHACSKITMDDLWGKGLIKSGRSNCTLSVEKLKEAGFEMPNAKEKIRRCVEEYAKCAQESTSL